MNITVIRLVIVATSTGSVVMCKILSVVVAFVWMRALILLSLAATHYRSSWFSDLYYQAKYDNSNNEYEVSVVCIVNLVICIIKLNMIIVIMNMKWV